MAYFCPRLTLTINQVTSNMNISELVKPLVEMGLTVKEALEVNLAEKEKQRQRK